VGQFLFQKNQVIAGNDGLSRRPITKIWCNIFQKDILVKLSDKNAIAVKTAHFHVRYVVDPNAGFIDSDE
jgi:hypothetical protein